MARGGSSSGGSRRLTFAVATGTSWFDASRTRGASIPRTDTAGFAHRRSAIVPDPINRTPGRTGACSRSSSSDSCTPSQVEFARPAIATSPASSCSVARIRARQESASGIAPP